MLTRYPNILYGSDYSPEPGPDSALDEDLQWFRAVGIHVATINVFAWSVDQPSESCYDFRWLDRVMDKLAEHQMYACLATATVTVPSWMAKQYGDVLSLDCDGLPRGMACVTTFAPVVLAIVA